MSSADSKSRFPYACPYCGRPNAVSQPGNSCGRVQCNVARSGNLHVVRPLVGGLAQGLSKGLPGTRGK